MPCGVPCDTKVLGLEVSLSEISRREDLSLAKDIEVATAGPGHSLTARARSIRLAGRYNPSFNGTATSE